jgi:hypothetical protein
MNMINLAFEFLIFDSHGNGARLKVTPIPFPNGIGFDQHIDTFLLQIRICNLQYLGKDFYYVFVF